MGKRVLKFYPMGVVPVDHKFLHAAVVSDDLFVWLEVDDACDTMMPSPYVGVTTGYAEVPKGAVHKMTAINYRTGFVAHVYDTRG